MAIKKMREVATEERNTKIENMGLFELRKYLCMKNYQNPEKCRDCPGRKNCRAGQRAIVLLDEVERLKMEEKMNEQAETSPVKTQAKVRSRKDIADEKKQIFITALQQPDMIKFLIDNYGNNRNSAREKLKYWRSAYPDIAEQYGFDEKFSALSREMPGHMRKTADAKRDGAMERYREAVAQDDPITFMMDKYGISREKAVHNFYQWKKRYGVIKKEDLQVEHAEVKANVAVENDEVSVEDFLKEVNVAAEEKPGKKPEAKPEEPVLAQAPVFTKEDDFYGELNAKYYELEKEKASLTARIAWIEKAQEALVMTAKVFNGDASFPSGR